MAREKEQIRFVVPKKKKFCSIETQIDAEMLIFGNYLRLGCTINNE